MLHIISLLIFFLSPFVLLPQCDNYIDPKITFVELSAILLFFVWAIKLLTKEKLEIVAPSLYFPAFLFILVLFISSFSPTTSSTFLAVKEFILWTSFLIISFIIAIDAETVDTSLCRDLKIRHEDVPTLPDNRNVDTSWCRDLKIRHEDVPTLPDNRNVDTSWCRDLKIRHEDVPTLPDNRNVDTSWCRNNHHIKRLLTVISFGGLLLSLYGILQYFGIDFVNYKSRTFASGGSFRVYATFGMPNLLAGYLAAIFPVSVSMAIISYRNIRSQNPEVRTQKSEPRSQNTEIPNLKSQVPNPKSPYSEIENRKSKIENPHSALHNLKLPNHQITKSPIGSGQWSVVSGSSSLGSSSSSGLSGSNNSKNSKNSRNSSLTTPHSSFAISFAFYALHFALLITPVLIILCIVLTNTRSAEIAMICGLFFFLLFCRSFLQHFQLSKMKFFAVVIVFFLFVSAFFMYSNVSTENKKISILQRIATWRITYEMIKQHPVLGVGPGNFRLLYLNYQRDFLNNVKEDKKSFVKYSMFRKEKPRTVHNEFLQIFAETGIVGFAAFILLVITSFECFFRVLKTTQDWESAVMLSGVGTGLINCLADAFFSFPLHVPPIALVFFLFIFLNIWFYNVSIADDFQKSGELGKHRRFLSQITSYKIEFSLHYFKKSYVRNFLIGILIIIVIILSIEVIKPLLARLYLTQGERYVSAEQLENAVISYNTALKLEPRNGEIHFYRGVAYSKMGETEKAIKDLQSAKISSNDPNIYFNLGVLYYEKKDYNRALQELKIADEMMPVFTQSKQMMFRIYIDKRDKKNAVRILEEILEIEPRNKQAKKLLKDLERW